MALSLFLPCKCLLTFKVGYYSRGMIPLLREGPEILSMQVSWENFQNFALLRQSAHRLAVALDFFFSTEGKIGREDFERAVVKVLGHSLPALLVSACCTAEGMHTALPLA